LTPRERILRTITGRETDRLAWTIYSGLLPRSPEADELIEMGLGLVSVVSPYIVERPNVRVTRRETPEEVFHLFETPVGCLTQRVRRERGYGSLWVKEHLVKGLEEYRILKFIVQDTIYRPNYDSFVEAEGRMGERGVIMAGLERAPFQKMWIEFTGIERLSVDLHENPTLVEELFETILEKQREMWRIVANSPAMLVWCPDNITGAITGPKLFRRYLIPYYREVADLMHSNGKKVVTHMDGPLRSIVREIGETPIDVIEAFTPPPDGDLPLDEAKRSWPDKVIWINFPSSIHVAPPKRIREVTMRLLREAIPGDRVLFGVTENIPEDAWRRSLKIITEAINETGGV